MERVWVFSRVAISMAVVDFLDPAEASRPDARERGVRVEVRPVRSTRAGSIYASDALSLGAGLCRLDFLESSPGAADRMHWHPAMAAGEPGERTFDASMPLDPHGWLLSFLRGGLGEHLGSRSLLTEEIGPDLRSIGTVADEVATALDDGLKLAREPWPVVGRDERGMALDR